MDLSRISPQAKIGANVRIGDFTIIHDNVIIEDNVQIESFCELGVPSPLSDGSPLRIGKNSLIRSHSIFYAGSTFGAGLRTGHRVTVREKTHAGIDLQIGTLSDFQGHLTIGDHSRTHSSVHLGQSSQIGSFVWIFPYTVLTNDPHPPSEVRLGVVVEDYAIIATMCCILPGIRIGTRSFVGAGSIVNRDVEPDTLVVGNPARKVGPTSQLKLRDGSGLPAYPWTERFHRGYPKDVVERWMRERSA
jgi:acetyltransferase-like isoleucine patch superfamily enzyme